MKQQKKLKTIGIFLLAISLPYISSCGGSSNNDTELTFYQDLDGDSIGNSNVFMKAINAPDNYVPLFGDFDDENSEVQTIQDAALALVTSLGGTDTYALETYVNQDVYIQHNQSFPDGVGAVIGGVRSGFLSGTTYTISRIITDMNEEGDTIVILHGIYAGNWNNGNPQIAFDVFRFDAESGLVEEHWDNLMSPSDPIIDIENGNTQLDGETLISNVDLTADNKRIVQNFITDVLVGGSWLDLAPMYFDEQGNFIQHSPGVENGIAWFSDLGEGFQKYDDESPRFLYGEGNFVLTLSQGSPDQGLEYMAYYDLFRLEDGKIVEHWDVIEEILNVDNSANTNGKW